MLIKVARFEMRYLARNPLLWATAAATFALLFAGSSIEGFDLGNEGGLLKNAAYATLRNYVMISVLYMFVTTAFVANAVLRDDETGYGPIIRSTGITRIEYVVGRFAGAFAIAALCVMLTSVGIVLGSIMPWAPASQLGPTRLADHLYAYFVVALPNLFIHGAIVFALATVTRSMMAAYLAVVGFVAGFFMLNEGFSGNIATAIAEPFAGRALKDAVHYWTVAERNVNLPELTGGLLYNRLVWVGIAIVCVTIACATFRFADQRMSKRERKRLKLLKSAANDDASPVMANRLPDPKHDSYALRTLVWMRTRFEVRQVILNPAFVMVLAWGLITTVFSLQNRDTIGRPTYPTTMTLIPHIAEAFSVVLVVLAMFYAGEVVWRERDRRIHELVDATPLPNWAYVIPKTFAMLLVLLSVVMVNVVAAIVFQLTSGFTEIGLDKYLLWYALPATWDVLLIAVLAIFVQALSRHKTIGWAVMVVFIAWKFSNLAPDYNLINYGAAPEIPLSEMNGADSFWKGAWIVRLYWGAFATLLLLGAHLLWRRGTEIRLRPRLAQARRRLASAPGLVAAVAFLVFAGTGAYGYYNINVLNEYRSPLSSMKHQAEFEKKYWKYVSLPQPTIAKMTVNIELYPEDRRAMTKGQYLLRNLTTQPIAEIHVRLMYDHLELLNSSINGARLVVNDSDFGYQIFRLDSPMQAGDERIVTFETRRWYRGFSNGEPNTRIVSNGTFLSAQELAPVIGMGRQGTLEDGKARKMFGLPPRGGREKPENVAAAVDPVGFGGWTTADITLSTVADQTPIAPGRKVSDVIRGGRRVAHFVSEAPIREQFSIQSARYAVKHRVHNGVDFAVYYHPAHGVNVDRMLDALGPSLDYYRANFGPYPLSHLRIVEYPGYANFAQAFAGTIPYSETYGFTADFRDPKIIDHVTLTTAHELAHQYWAHQVVPAEVKGSMLLSETLANYSALMVQKRVRPDQVAPALKYIRDRYLGWRGALGSIDEPPLIYVETESWIGYQKGALAMYLVQERLGEEAVNRALRNLLERFRFKGPPYARSLDLVAALRAEAKTEEDQNLITDLFERVTLYDLKVTEPTAVQRADGKWDVTVPVEAKKLAVDSKGGESEATLNERIEVGLFTADPGDAAFHPKDIIVMERRPIRSGAQVLKFVTDRKPAYAGIDPYNYYIDRNSWDNVKPF